MQIETMGVMVTLLIGYAMTKEKMGTNPLNTFACSPFATPINQ